MRYRPITRNKEFGRVYARGRSYVHPKLVLYVNKNRLGHTRWASPPPKGGGAVQRNRARRVMRAALYENPALQRGRLGPGVRGQGPNGPLQKRRGGKGRPAASAQRGSGGMIARLLAAPIRFIKVHFAPSGASLPFPAHLQRVCARGAGGARRGKGRAAGGVAHFALQPLRQNGLRPRSRKGPLENDRRSLRRV